MGRTITILPTLDGPHVSLDHRRQADDLIRLAGPAPRANVEEVTDTDER